MDRDFYDGFSFPVLIIPLPCARAGGKETRNRAAEDPYIFNGSNRRTLKGRTL